jgi:hypothetical protein
MIRFLTHQYRHACRAGLRRGAIARAVRTYFVGF